MNLKNNKKAWQKRNIDIVETTNTSTITSESNNALFVIRVLGTLHIVFGIVSIYNHFLLYAYLLIQSGILIHIIAGNWEVIKNV